MATRIVTLRMDVELLRRVDALAAAKEVSRSKYIEDLVAEAVPDAELTVRAMTDPVIAPAILGAIAKPEVLRAMSAVLRQELTDEQLSLFQSSTQALEAHLAKQQQPRPAAKRTPRGVAPKKRRRGHK